MKYLKNFVAEALGTFLLALVVGCTATGISLFPEYQALFIPFLMGVVLMLIFYILNPISGAHFNPAVSVGLFVGKLMDWQHLVTDLVGQVIGAVAGFVFARILMDGAFASSPASETGTALLGEALGAFVLVFAVTSVVLGKINETIGGVVIGLAFAVGVTISLVASGGLLNPALALGWGVEHLSYYLGPIIGGVIGVLVVQWLYNSKKR